MGNKERGIEYKFLNKIEKTKDCWRWCGQKDMKGYGKIYIGKFLGVTKFVMAHRLSYEYFVGEIPDGLVIDHLCNNTSCVNPGHLEPKTIYENAKRGFRKDRSFLLAVGGKCKKGHLLKEGDISTYSNKNKACLPCKHAEYAIRARNNRKYLRGVWREQYRRKVARLANKKT